MKSAKKDRRPAAAYLCILYNIINKEITLDRCIFRPWQPRAISLRSWYLTSLVNLSFRSFGDSDFLLVTGPYCFLNLSLSAQSVLQTLPDDIPYMYSACSDFLFVSIFYIILISDRLICRLPVPFSGTSSSGIYLYIGITLSDYTLTQPPERYKKQTVQITNRSFQQKGESVKSDK